MKAKVIVTLKKEVSDPQGLAVTQSLESLQFKGIKGVRVGKFFEVELDGLTKEDAEKQIDAASATTFVVRLEPTTTSVSPLCARWPPRDTSPPPSASPMCVGGVCVDDVGVVSPHRLRFGERLSLDANAYVERLVGIGEVAHRRHQHGQRRTAVAGRRADEEGQVVFVIPGPEAERVDARGKIGRYLETMADGPADIGDVVVMEVDGVMGERCRCG